MTPDGAVAHEHLAGRGRRLGQVAHPQHIGVTMGVDHDRAHADLRVASCRGADVADIAAPDQSPEYACSPLKNRLTTVRLMSTVSH